MVNKRLLLTSVALTAIGATTTWTFAMYANQQMWNWKHQLIQQWQMKWKMWQSQWNWQMWNRWQRNSQMWKKSLHNSDISSMLNDVEKQDISDYEAERLAYQYSEEMVARDIYNYLYKLYNIQVFKNIADSENRHMEAVKVLLDRYGLETPTGYWPLQEEFEALKKEGEKWIKQALEVGAKIEMMDIDDIVETIKNTDNDDIKIVFTNIGWGSYNHLRWFLQSMKNNWITTDLDYSNYLTEEEVNIRWRALKTKLAEKLESEWVKLPEQASAKSIWEKYTNEQNNKTHWNNFKWYNQQNNRQNIVKYKEFIENKYAWVLDAMSHDKLKELQTKVETLLTTIQNSSDYTQEKKIIYYQIFKALNMCIEERISSYDATNIIDNLLWQ